VRVDQGGHGPTQPLLWPERQTIEERFLEFHTQNLHVYEALRDVALRLKRAGWKHYGLKAMWEGLRFMRALTTTADDFKLNNDFTSRYARLLMQSEPELEGFFEVRELRSR
jgi:hypothetical protein